MKIVVMIARCLFGLVFFILGLNAFLNFIPTGPLPTGQAGAYFGVMFATHYMLVVGGVMVVTGLLFVANRFMPLALIATGPVLFNILCFHILMLPQTIGLALVVVFLWIVVAWQYRAAFAFLLEPRYSQERSGN